MHRVTALVLAAALAASSGGASAWHVHLYADHDHPEHHHGPAVYDHHESPQHAPDAASRLEGCDPGEHAVSFVFVCTTAASLQLVFAELGQPVDPTSAARAHLVRPRMDVRVHGPPPLVQASPRAPPPTLHA